MKSPLTAHPVSHRLDPFIVILLGLCCFVALVTAVSLEGKWQFFLIFMMVALSLFLILPHREKFILYLAVVLMSVHLNFHPVFVPGELHPWPVGGLRISIFEVAFLLLLISWAIRLVTDATLTVRLYPWISVPFLVIWALTLFSNYQAAMPWVIKFSTSWLVLESWLIFLYFANNLTTPRTIYNMVAALLLTGLLQAVLGVLQYLTGSSLGLTFFGEAQSILAGPVGGEFISRVAGTIGHPNNLAGYLNMVIQINLALLFAPIARFYKKLLLPLLALTAITLILTFSRGGWLAMGLGGAVTGYLCLARRSQSRIVPLLVSVSLVALLLVSSLVLITPLKKRFFEEDYGAARSRIPMSVVAWNIIQSHPWLGIGLSNYVNVAPYYDTTKEAIAYEFPRPVHNEFLLIGAELGVPALVCFLVILAALLVQLFKGSRSREDPVLPYIAIGLLGTYFGWCFFRQTDYAYVLLADPFWLLAGLSQALVALLSTSASTANAEPGGAHYSS
jgi:putative inorganic carbon (HCO3(-)) transporter